MDLKKHIDLPLDETVKYLGLENVNDDIVEDFVEPFYEWKCWKEQEKKEYLDAKLDYYCTDRVSIKTDQFKNNKKHGEGEYKYHNGDEFKGYWKDGKKDGNGTYQTSKYVFNGEYRNNKKNGFGKIAWHDNEMYEGNYKDSRYDGKGFYRFSDGDCYYGDFVDGKYEGIGTETIGVTVYFGEFQNDKRDGKGVLINKLTNEKYVGKFKNGKKHGFGKLNNKNVMYDQDELVVEEVSSKPHLNYQRVCVLIEQQGNFMFGMNNDSSNKEILQKYCSYNNDFKVENCNIVKLNVVNEILYVNIEQNETKVNETKVNENKTKVNETKDSGISTRTRSKFKCY
jgi:hypothetical protein